MPSVLAPVAAGTRRPQIAQLVGSTVGDREQMVNIDGIGITLDQYGHLLPGAEDEASAMLDAFLARQVGGSSAPTAPQTAPHPVESQS
jgi:hypothetical protein